MEIFVQILKILAVLIIAFIFGKLVSKLRLPAILGWLVVGMVFGPYGFKFLSNELFANVVYGGFSAVAQCFVGVMIGSELVWKKLKKSGKQILFTTLWQSLGTFAIVSLIFGVIFHFMNIPLYLALIFGGIALATAPAPALSIVKEFKTRGPVTSTLIPMAALDDVVGVIVFFTIISIVSATISTGGVSPLMIVAVVLLPFIIGGIVGLAYGLISRKIKNRKVSLFGFIVALLISFGISFVIDNFVLPSPALNYMLVGMAMSALYANFAPTHEAEDTIKSFNPVLMISLIIAIVNLGAPLDFRLIAGAGLFTLVYIVARAIGKIGGSMLGAKLNKCDKNVVKYLGLTLLPHSGVSLIFTGIAVGVLAIPAPEEARIIQGTIAAAAVINEIIAVIMSKYAFKWAGEINKGGDIGNALASDRGIEELSSNALASDMGIEELSSNALASDMGIEELSSNDLSDEDKTNIDNP